MAHKETEAKKQTFLYHVLDILAVLAIVMIVALYINIARADALVKNLPERGIVMLSGTVAEVKDQNHFTLKDKEGATIAVESKSAIAIAKGENVTVEGEVQKDALGTEKKIMASTVSTPGAGSAKTSQGQIN